MGLSDAVAGARNEAGIASVLGILRQRFGERVDTGASRRAQHAHTTTYIPGQPPDAVVKPDNAAEVSEIVRMCAAHRTPVIAFGVGTSLEGQVNAPHGGICLDMSGMDRIVSVNEEDLDCVVEPGVTRETLNRRLRDTGLFFPIDPGADASLGGMASTRASGTNAVRYGTMKDNVLALNAVLADGREIASGTRAKKSSAGYDLTRLLVGAEGTLGVITRLTLRLHGIPEAIVSGVCPFDSVCGAVDAVIATIRSGIPVARIELLDALSMRAANDYSGLDYTESPALFVEFHGSEAHAAEQADLFGDIARDFGSGAFIHARAEEERNRLWKARHDAFWAGLRLRPGADAVVTDVCVPISKLGACIAATQDDAAGNGLVAPIVGHVGDGNFHVMLLIDRQSASEVDKAEAFIARLNERALSFGGTCTGEHGIGQGKKGALAREAGGALGPMRAIKRALDPDGIMNPGKIFA